MYLYTVFGSEVNYLDRFSKGFLLPPDNAWRNIGRIRFVLQQSTFVTDTLNKKKL